MQKFRESNSQTPTYWGSAQHPPCPHLPSYVSIPNIYYVPPPLQFTLHQLACCHQKIIWHTHNCFIKLLNNKMPLTNYQKVKSVSNCGLVARNVYPKCRRTVAFPEISLLTYIVSRRCRLAFSVDRHSRWSLSGV